MALIDLSNYSTTLKQSAAGRAGSPDGNVFFDVATGQIQLITVEELPTVDFGGGAVTNPLSNQDGITMGALYAFERQERRTDETLRQYDFYFAGSFKFAGAYEIVNGRKFNTTDRVKIRGSGWIERSTAGLIDRIYFGVRSLGAILSGSQPYYQLASGGAPTNFAKPGPVDEAVQVFGTTANGDAGAGNFDSRTFFAISVRTFGQNFDRKTLTDSGVTEMGGYTTGFAVGESAHLTSGGYDLADVYGGAQIAPWTGMTLQKLGAPQNETGFNEGAGDFTWVLNNTSGGTLDECVAYLDAVAQTDDDIDAGAGVVNGKRVNSWYSYDAQGRVVTRSGDSTGGLFIEQLPTSDQQSVVFTTDASTTRTYPFNVDVQVSVGANAAADTNAWYHCYFLDGPATNDFNTADAITVLDSDGLPVKGTVGGLSTITFGFDYDGDTIGGAAGTNKQVVFECEGDGSATQKKTTFTLTRTAVVTASCEPGLESNV